MLLEVGPGQVLGSLSRQHPSCNRDRAVVSSLRHPQKQENDLAVLMSALGRLWTSGVSVDWFRFHAGQQRRRVALPTYPLERQRYWVERRTERAGGARTRKDIADWFYVRVWRRTPTQRPPKADGTSKANGRCWLVFSDGSTLGSWISEGLARGDRHVIVVTIGPTFAKTANGYAIDPACREHYDQLIADLNQRALIPREILHLWTLAPDNAQRPDDNERGQDLGFFSLLSLAQALGESEVVAPIRITAVTDRIHEVTGDEMVRAEAATVLGPCRVIGLEFPNCVCRNIDVSADELTSPDDPRLTMLVGELLSSAEDPVVAYRGGRRWVEAFAPVHLPEVAEDLHPRLRRGGTYLITGAFGGMGMALARELAGALQARLVLTSRTACPIAQAGRRTSPSTAKQMS